MKTKKLYRNNVYLSKHDTCITDIKEDMISLAETIFFPEGGGQSCDKGTISGFTVDYVFENDDIVWHKIPNHNFKVGDNVSCILDWGHRFENMQRHCGEHIMSGMWHREYGGVNRGFHMGENYMTIDIRLEDNPNFQTITWDMAMHIEDCTNEVIYQNLPVVSRHFDTKKEAENLPLRKKLSIEKDITIVSVGDINNPSDCVACCGTHPSTSGQVGLVKIYKVEKNKDMFRIYFDAGKKSLLDYRKKDALLTSIGNKYSAGIDDIEKKLTAQEDKYIKLKETHALLRNSVINERSEIIKKDLAVSNSNILVYEYSDLTVDDILYIGKNISDDLTSVVVICDLISSTALLFSNGKVHCGKLVKENADVFRGKGGGRDTSSRAIFPNNELMHDFIFSIKNII